MKQAGKEEKYYDVLAEIPVVRKDFGYPPLVTPTSQIVGTQAVFNVLMGRYKTFPKESKALLAGEYGALPGEVNEEVRKMASAIRSLSPAAPLTCWPLSWTNTGRRSRTIWSRKRMCLATPCSPR